MKQTTVGLLSLKLNIETYKAPVENLILMTEGWMDRLLFRGKSWDHIVLSYTLLGGFLYHFNNNFRFD